MQNQKKRILFLCTGNSCRSQMAEGFMRKYHGDKFEVFSAGLNPSIVNHYTINVMKEIGIDISNQASKSVELFVNLPFDYVITVCDNARESCPVFKGKVNNIIHWAFEDPAPNRGTEEEIIKKFREVRDLIELKIKSFFHD